MKQLLYTLLFLICSLQAYNPLVISIEGNSAAGKTTLARLVAEQLNAKVVIEPFEQWCNVNDIGNLFGRYIVDKDRWAFSFQVYALHTYATDLNNAIKEGHQVIITDRSPYTCMGCFVPMQHDAGYIDNLEYEIYRQIFEQMTTSLLSQPKFFIYLRTSPQECLSRDIKRSRRDRNELDMEIFETMQNYYDKWLYKNNEYMNARIDIPILIIDGNKDFLSDKNRMNEITQQIVAFIHEHNITQ